MEPTSRRLDAAAFTALAKRRSANLRGLVTLAFREARAAPSHHRAAVEVQPLSLRGKLDGLTHDVDRHLAAKPAGASAFEQFMGFANASQRKHRTDHRLD